MAPPARRIIMFTIRRSVTAGAFAVVALLTVQACSSQSSDTRDSEADRQTSSEAGSAAAPEPATGGDAADDMASTTEDGSSTPDIDPSTRAVISSGTVSLRSRDVASARHGVQRVVDQVGGTIADENAESHDGTVRYVRMVLRVPSDQFARTMTSLSEVATVTASGRSSEDVTTQVIDTTVRIRAQQASLRRVEALLARAESIKDIAWIEAQLTSRQSDLDSLKQRQAWLRDQTSLSTVTVELRRTSTSTTAQDAEGFWAGLRSGWHALRASTSVVLQALGASIPFLIPLGLLVGMWHLLRRRNRRPGPVQG